MPVAFVEKRRVGTAVEILTVIGEVEGKDVILIDDEVDTAGTICDDIEVLMESRVRDIYCCFVHPVFSAKAAHRLGQYPIREIVTTNTLPMPEEKQALLPPTKIISVAALLAGVIRRVHEGRSVGEMYVPYHGYS